MSIRIDENEDIRTIQGGPVDLHKQSAAKARANLNGTGTIALRDSLNISSVVDGGTGTYTFNFTNNMIDANYSPASTNSPNSSTNRDTGSVYNMTVSSYTYSTWSSGGILQDYDIVSNIIHGDLA